MPTYEVAAFVPTGTTSPIVRGSPLPASGTTVVPTPLKCGLLPASGKVYLEEQPFAPTEAPSGLRYPVRQVTVIRKLVEVGTVEPIDVIAGETLSGHRIVTVSGGEVLYASGDDLSTFQGILGITMNAANVGETVSVKPGGEITEPSWNWTSGLDLFLGTNGQLTQVVPPETPGTYLLRLGVAINATTISLDIEDPILL